MSFRKLFYWLIKIGAPLTLILLPSVAIYGMINTWLPAAPTLAKYQSETPIMVGFSESGEKTWSGGTWHDNGYSEREYILFPSVFYQPKIISIRQSADKSIIVTESLYSLIYMVIWTLFCMIATWFLWFRRPKETGSQSKP